MLSSVLEIMYHSFFQSNSFPVVNAAYVLNEGNDSIDYSNCYRKRNRHSLNTIIISFHSYVFAIFHISFDVLEIILLVYIFDNFSPISCNKIL